MPQKYGKNPMPPNSRDRQLKPLTETYANGRMTNKNDE
jgi:hypothetical protein